MEIANLTVVYEQKIGTLGRSYPRLMSDTEWAKFFQTALV